MATGYCRPGNSSVSLLRTMDFIDALNLFQRTPATERSRPDVHDVLAPTEITHFVNVGWDVTQGLLCL